jgi:hypothetical protein
MVGDRQASVNGRRANEKAAGQRRKPVRLLEPEVEGHAETSR